jgi:hypothetical protein
MLILIAKMWTTVDDRRGQRAQNASFILHSIHSLLYEFPVLPWSMRATAYTHDMRQLLTELVRAQRRQKAETTLRQPRKESDGTPQHHCALAVMREALSSRAVKSRGAG